MKNCVDSRRDPCHHGDMETQKISARIPRPAADRFRVALAQSGISAQLVVSYAVESFTREIEQRLKPHGGRVPVGVEIFLMAMNADVKPDVLVETGNGDAD